MLLEHATPTVFEAVRLRPVAPAGAKLILVAEVILHCLLTVADTVKGSLAATVSPQVVGGKSNPGLRVTRAVAVV